MNKIDKGQFILYGLLGAIVVILACLFIEAVM